MWALIILNFGANFTNYFQMNSLPTYYNEVLGYTVQQIAFIYAISSLIRFCTGLSFSYLGDILMSGGYLGITTQRKYFCIFCMSTIIFQKFAIQRFRFSSHYSWGHPCLHVFYQSTCSFQCRIRCLQYSLDGINQFDGQPKQSRFVAEFREHR